IRARLLRLAVAADLDEVDAVLHLPAHLAHHLVARRAQHALGGLRHAEPAREVVSEAAVGDDVATGREYARALEHAVGDGVPDRDRHVPGRAGIADARHARPEDLARVVHGSHRAPLRPAVHVDLL